MFEYSRGFGTTSREECESRGVQCESCDGVWYPTCIAGYHGDSARCNICVKGHTPPRVCTAPRISLAAVVLLLSLIIILVYVIYRYIAGKYTTADDIVEFEYGHPGSTDAYSMFASTPDANKIIYV